MLWGTLLINYFYLCVPHRVRTEHTHMYRYMHCNSADDFVLWQLLAFRGWKMDSWTKEIILLTVWELIMWQIRWIITIYKNNDLNHERTVADSYSMLYKIKAKMSCWHLWHHYIAFSSFLCYDVCHYSDIFNQSRHFVFFANFTTTRCKAKNLKATVLARFCLKFELVVAH